MRMELKPGDRVRIQYLGYNVEAVVVERPTMFDWVTVEQDYHGEKIRYEAAVEFVERVEP